MVIEWPNHIASPFSRFLVLINLGICPKLCLYDKYFKSYGSVNDFEGCWRPYWIFKKAMNEILHTLQKIFSYAYINSYQSLKKVCTPLPPYRKNNDISS